MMLPREPSWPVDEEDDARTFLRSIKSAQKSHPCGFCHGGRIAPGEPYDQFITIEAGRFSIARYCRGHGWPCPRANLF